MAKIVKKLRLRKAAVPSKHEKPDHLGPTERRWMSHKQKDRMFDVLTVMSEGNDPAFNILMTFFEKGADPLFHEMALLLDDMNIRGEQIEIAYKFVPGGLPSFIEAIRSRNRFMIDHVNATWIKSFMEQAVPSGAHRWMHKKIVTPPHGAS